MIGTRATASGARPRRLQTRTHAATHTHVLQRLQGRALRQGGRQRARALRADAVVAKTVVPGSRLSVHAPQHQAQGRHPSPPNTHPCGHAHVLQRLQGRALWQCRRQCARAVNADAVGFEPLVRICVIATRATTSGARPPAQPPKARIRVVTPTYCRACRALHCGSAAARVRAPSAQMLFQLRLWGGVVVMGPHVRFKAAIPTPQTSTYAIASTYSSVCRDVHSGSTAAKARAPSTPMSLYSRLPCGVGIVWPTRPSIRVKGHHP